VSARGATFIALANSAFLPVKARNSFRMIAFSTAMRIDPDQVIQLSENFYQAAINKAFHSHQIRIIYHAAEADKLTYLKLLDKEGTDIYAHVRRPELQQIQNIADNLLDAEKRVHLSDILKSMDNATLNQLEKDLAGEGGEALRALFGEKVGCVKAWEINEYAEDIANASNARKGNFGEIGAVLDLNAKGYTSLQPRIDGIDSPGHNDLDGIYVKNGEYFVVEGKYTGSASLNPADPTTGLPRQMSDDWITSRDWSNINLDQATITNLLQTKNYKRILAKVSPDGAVSYQYVGSTGYLTPNGPGSGGAGPFGEFIP
jgi:hypothetical protein